MVSVPATNTKKRGHQRRQEWNFASEKFSLIDGVCCSVGFQYFIPVHNHGLLPIQQPHRSASLCWTNGDRDLIANMAACGFEIANSVTMPDSVTDFEESYVPVP